MAGDLLGVSISGLSAAQRNLTTTGHNIANANTEGYSRQRVELAARVPQLRGDGAVGTGVTVANVSRVYDQFVSGEVWDNTSVSNSLDVSHDYTSQVDNLLSDPNAGLAPALQSFFAAVNGVADDPSSASSRQVMISESNSLSQRFDYLDDRLDGLRKGINKDVKNIINDINDMAKSIAGINETIVKAREIGGQAPSDLLDQRDRLVEKLSTLVAVRTSIQDDERMNVFIGNGQALVIGDVASNLVAQGSRNDPDEVEVIFKSGSGAEALITKFLTGGKIGGLLDFRQGILDAAQNELGRIAIGISKTFNEQHRMGMDINNELGGNFFFDNNKETPVVLPMSLNKGDTIIQAEITSVDKLTVSDYQLDYREGQYTLIRMSDDKVVGQYKSLPADIVSEGFKLNIIGGSNIKTGDSFIIRPTRMGAENFSVTLTDVNKIAAASPLRTEASISNIGDGEISAAVVNDISNPIFDKQNNNLSPPFVVRFVDNEHFELLDNTGNAIPIKRAAIPEQARVKQDENGRPILEEQQPGADPAGISTRIKYDSKNGTEIFPLPDGTDFGFRVKLTGKPMKGDTFRFEFNMDGVGDNQNAVSLSSLQDKAVLADSTASYTQAYSQLISRVGSKTHELDVNRNAQKLLLDQAIDRRESISGVNLDEEAANMVRYQNLYQANAQVVATANKMLDELINAFR
ncbi:MAG: flagellar hook-associated protein FlgK [Gammaproteobacteria bacterium]|nr:flagellar hook-associated protein FlgK [Gammaproteobacteria bacterium]